MLSLAFCSLSVLQRPGLPAVQHALHRLRKRSASPRLAPLAIPAQLCLGFAGQMAFLGALATMCCVAVSLCAFSAICSNLTPWTVRCLAFIEVDDCSRTQPVLALAILDQGLQRETLLDNPKAYGSAPCAAYLPFLPRVLSVCLAAALQSCCEACFREVCVQHRSFSCFETCFRALSARHRTIPVFVHLSLECFVCRVIAHYQIGAGAANVQSRRVRAVGRAVSATPVRCMIPCVRLSSWLLRKRGVWMPVPPPLRVDSLRLVQW